jgi:hypothetical protein
LGLVRSLGFVRREPANETVRREPEAVRVGWDLVGSGTSRGTLPHQGPDAILSGLMPRAMRTSDASTTATRLIGGPVSS